MAVSMSEDKQKISQIGGALQSAVSEFADTQSALKEVASGLGIDNRRHVLIKDRFEDAVLDIAQTQSMVS
jgi:hypothetical protein